jgi:hypothetical protein
LEIMLFASNVLLSVLPALHRTPAPNVIHLTTLVGIVYAFTSAFKFKFRWARSDQPVQIVLMIALPATNMEIV